MTEATTTVTTVEQANAEANAAIDDSPSETGTGKKHDITGGLKVDLQESDGKRLLVEAFPIMGPLHGITLRIESDPDTEHRARWIDITLKEANGILNDLAEQIAMVEQDLVETVNQQNADHWADKYRKPAVKWVVTDYSDEMDHATPEHKGKFGVMSEDTVVAWFTEKANAETMVERLNNRPK